jgi:cytidylate kinase
MLITLSRQRGSSGDEIAARLARALGLTLIDRALIHDAALAAGVPDDLLHRLMYEGQRTLAGQVMDSLGGATHPSSHVAASQMTPLGGIFSPPLPPASIGLEEGVRTIGRVIREVTANGEALVLGQGGQVLLRDHPAACHVLVVAPVERRVARVAAEMGLSPAAARRAVRANDLARADYLARYHNLNWLDPTQYHLVVNTGLLTVEAAVSIIIATCGALGLHKPNLPKPEQKHVD